MSGERVGCSDDRGQPFFVLVGGDAQEYQGGLVGHRHHEHTSLSHIGKTYSFLRDSGIPRRNIITIVQLKDFFRCPHMEGSRPAESGYWSDCRLLIEEGGADYDYTDVNPGTVWSVLQGAPVPGSTCQKVVPDDSGAIFFAIYSHGDCHPCSAAQSRALRADNNSIGSFEPPAKLDPMQHEWFAHMPYRTEHESLRTVMLSFVATEGATGPHFSSPERYLYATQLRAVFLSLFKKRPNRPVIALLNFCRSGGALGFMRNPVSRDYYSASRWPLVLISSSQPEHDALVGGMWSAFFHHLTVEIKKVNVAMSESSAVRTRSSVAETIESPTILQLVEMAKTSYFQRNVYALHDFVVNSAYVSSLKRNSYSKDLRPLLASGAGGMPDYDAIAELQARYRRGKVLIWDTYDWGGPEVELASVVKDAFETKIAVPDFVYGSGSDVHNATIAALIGRI